MPFPTEMIWMILLLYHGEAQDQHRETPEHAELNGPSKLLPSMWDCPPCLVPWDLLKSLRMVLAVTFPPYQGFRIHQHSLDTVTEFLCAPSDVPCGLIMQILSWTIEWNILLQVSVHPDLPRSCSWNWVFSQAVHPDLPCSIGEIRPKSIPHRSLLGGKGRVPEPLQCCSKEDPAGWELCEENPSCDHKAVTSVFWFEITGGITHAKRKPNPKPLFFFGPATVLLSIKQQQQPPLQLPKLLNE